MPREDDAMEPRALFCQHGVEDDDTVADVDADMSSTAVQNQVDDDDDHSEESAVQNQADDDGNNNSDGANT